MTGVVVAIPTASSNSLITTPVGHHSRLGALTFPSMKLPRGHHSPLGAIAVLSMYSKSVQSKSTKLLMSLWGAPLPKQGASTLHWY